MKKCVFCLRTVPLSAEHIFPALLGYKSTSKDVICEQCNNKLGSEVDRVLEKTFKSLLVLKGTENSRSKHRPQLKFKSKDGKNLIFQREKKRFTLAHPIKPEVKWISPTRILVSQDLPADHNLERAKEELLKLAKREARKTNPSTPEDQWGQAMVIGRQPMPKADIPFSFSLDFTDPGLQRVFAKIGFLGTAHLLGSALLSTPAFDRSREVVLGRASAELMPFPAVPPLEPDLVHAVIPHSQDGYLMAVVILFGSISVLVRLGRHEPELGPEVPCLVATSTGKVLIQSRQAFGRLSPLNDEACQRMIHRAFLVARLDMELDDAARNYLSKDKKDPAAYWAAVEPHFSAIRQWEKDFEAAAQLRTRE